MGVCGRLAAGQSGPLAKLDASTSDRGCCMGFCPSRQTLPLSTANVLLGALNNSQQSSGAAEQGGELHPQIMPRSALLRSREFLIAAHLL